MKNKMMVALLLMIVGVTGLSFVAPWWTASVWIIVVAGMTGLNKKQGILSGSFALGFVWLAMALYMSLMDDANIIGKTGALLGGLSTPSMIILTFVIAIITGLFSGWFGSALGQVIRPRSTEEV